MTQKTWLTIFTALMILCLATPGHSAAVLISATEQSQLQDSAAQHLRVEARLSAADQDLLAELTLLVERRLFAAPRWSDLLVTSTQIVNAIIPELTDPEAASLAQYALGDILNQILSDPAASSSALRQRQADFQQQMLQVQMSMQHENQIFTSVSNVLKTRHDTVKNSIGNVR